MQTSDKLFAFFPHCVVLAFLATAYTTGFVLRKFIFNKKWNGFLGALAMAIIFLSGMMLVQVRKQLIGGLDIRNLLKYQKYQATVISPAEIKERSYKVLLSVDAVEANKIWQPASGKVVFTVSDTSQPVLHYGDRILVAGMPKPLKLPVNPGDFDYRKYLERQQIFRIHKVTNELFVRIGHVYVNPIMHYAIYLRDNCAQVLNSNIASQQEYEVAAALILGIKGNLDPSIKQAYTNTGVIHVLAVSGMHIAIVYEVLLLFFGRYKSNRFGKYILYAGIASVLWFFGFISGLSPSVLRAVVMFSFVLLAKAMNRDSEIYNTIAASAFFLLCYNPYYAVDVGFQLSYIAVAGIVYLQPKIYAIIFIRKKYCDKAWGLISVTLAAQLATVPLIMLYFHQLPVWFLPANLIMIPGTTIMLYLGILLLVFSWLTPVAAFLGYCMHWSLWFLHYLLMKIESLPAALISDLSITNTECLLLFGIILGFFIFCATKNYLAFIATNLFLFLFILSAVVKNYHQTKQLGITVYTVHNKPVLALFKGKEAILLYDSSLKQNDIDLRIRNNLLELGIEKIEFTTWNNCKNLTVPVKTIEGCKLLVWQNMYFLHAPSGLISAGLQKIFRINLPCKIKNCLLIGRSGTGFAIVNLDEEKSWNEKIIKQIKVVHLPYHNIAQLGAYIHKFR